ncbi:hypothetical protein WJX84_002385 [Apatococcus fuscideae]|uniref:Uncharacterized protein n=1 Tax=Apatococcus fuscideae TaxID=2026836 RepID=A0AAW1SS06_9CHLO
MIPSLRMAGIAIACVVAAVIFHRYARYLRELVATLDNSGQLPTFKAAGKAEANFFNITAQTLTSKWFGESEKLVRLLFVMAAEMEPSIIFIDEIDSILSERSASAADGEANLRLKTQFLLEFDGVERGSEHVVVIGATNRPQELDDAVRRRLVKRVYIPLPDLATREAMLKATLQDQPNLRLQLCQGELHQIVQATQGYSGSDLAALCREAAWVHCESLVLPSAQYMLTEDFGTTT